MERVIKSPTRTIIRKVLVCGIEIPKDPLNEDERLRRTVITMLTTTEIISHLWGGVLRMLNLSEVKLRAITSSMNTKRKKRSVLAEVKSWFLRKR